MENLVDEIIESYDFAKENGFDSINIVIDCKNDKEYRIFETEDGLFCDLFSCAYIDIDDIADDVAAEIGESAIEVRIE